MRFAFGICEAALKPSIHPICWRLKLTDPAFCRFKEPIGVGLGPGAHDCALARAIRRANSENEPYRLLPGNPELAGTVCVDEAVHRIMDRLMDRPRPSMTVNGDHAAPGSRGVVGDLFSLVDLFLDYLEARISSHFPFGRRRGFGTVLLGFRVPVASEDTCRSRSASLCFSMTTSA